MTPPNSQLKIFISAYACEPLLGSEIGVGWHWVLEMSRYFELWVLTRESNRHTIEPWIAAHPEYHSIHFLYYDLPRWATWWKKGLRGVRLYYILWQLGINSLVKQTMQENSIEIFHHLTYGNFLWPVSRYGQHKFFIWGPGSIGNSVPKEFSKEYSLKGRGKEMLQRLVCQTLRYNISFNKRCRNSNLVLCKTADTHHWISRHQAERAVLFTDVASQIEDIKAYNHMNSATNNGIIKYIAVGSLDGWRGFDILIEAFSAALKVAPTIQLEILGEGCERGKLEKQIKRLMLEDKVHLSGKVDLDEYYRRLASADVVVNPCLREGAVTLAFDAIALGKPIVCIETGGYTRHFNERYAVLIPLRRRRETIEDMTRGLLSLTDERVREQKGIHAQEAAKEHTWSHKGEMIYELINNSYSEWRSRRGV